MGAGLGGNEFDFGDDGTDNGACPGNKVTGSVLLISNSAETEVDLNNPVVEGGPNLPKNDELPNVVKGAFTCQLNYQLRAPRTTGAGPAHVPGRHR